MERFADEVLMNAIGVMKTMNDCYGELTEPLDIVRYKFLQELKEYRDTGLTPEQVRELAEVSKTVNETLNGTLTVADIVQFFLAYYEANSTGEEVADAILLSNQEASRWRDYRKAEEQRLLLRLPCKVGDILYQPTRDIISEYRIIFFNISTCNNIFLHTKLIFGINIVGEIFTEDKIGENVFLTREEAEEKLAEMEDRYE